jgi:hypothetical protein
MHKQAVRELDPILRRVDMEVGRAWAETVASLITEVKDLSVAAQDGRPLPEWLRERLIEIDKLLEQL